MKEMYVVKSNLLLEFSMLCNRGGRTQAISSIA